MDATRVRFVESHGFVPDASIYLSNVVPCGREFLDDNQAKFRKKSAIFVNPLSPKIAKSGSMLDPMSGLYLHKIRCQF